MRTDRHRALIVDDDAGFADAVDGIVRSMGHLSVLAHDEDTAWQQLELHPFCYVMLDLQLPVSEGDIPRVATGYALLERIRERWAAEYLPVIVMTGHGKDHSYCRKALLAGASDFLKKPFRSSGPEQPESVIGEWVAKGCEAHHDCCPNMAPVPRVATSEPYAIYLHGDRSRRRFRVSIRGSEMLLAPQQFKALAHLVLARLASGTDGWWQAKWVFEDRTHMTLSRLRSDLKPLLGEAPSYLENNGDGGYRLAFAPEQLGYDAELMRQHHATLMR